MAFCTNCGGKLVDGSRFCHMCGQPARTMTCNTKQRNQEYVGSILKCPNCGGIISETTAICPDCGFQLTQRSAVSSVEKFKSQLMELENHRKKSHGGVFGVYATADPVDKQKLSLIRNFPIPNSVDDCLEFMMLAIANIDVSISKRTLANSSQNMELFAMEMPRAISNAWVAKMEQVYNKARVAFPNEPAFSNIERVYLEKSKELRIKVN